MLISAKLLKVTKFYRFYLKAAKADAVVEKRVKYLAVLALTAHEQLCYWPSTVAAALVILACLEVDQNAFHKVIGVITIATELKALLYLNHKCINKVMGTNII